MSEQPLTPASGRGTPWMLLGGLFAGALALAFIILAEQGDTKYAAVVLGGTLMLLIAVPMVGNIRLFCLYMILLLAPLGLRLSFMRFPHMGGASAIFIEVVDPFLLVLLYFQARDRLRGYRARYRFPTACKIWVALILLGLGTVVFGSLRTTAANELVRMLKLLLLVLLIVNEVVRRRQFQHAIVALTLGVILESAIALTQYLAGAQLGLQILGESTDEDISILAEGTLATREFVYRVGGLLGHANFLGAYLALLMPMAVALLLAPVSRRLKALLAVALLLGQPALVLTLSRTGWIDFSVAFLIVLALGALHAESRRKFLLARIVVLTITVAITAALSPLIIQRLFDADPNSVKYRGKWVQTARAMIIDNPVLGVGLNNYVFAQLPYAEEKTPLEMTARYGDYWPAVHNAWLLTWAEQGTLGFLIYLAFHIAVLAVGVRNLRIRDPMMHALGVGLIAGFVAIMVDGLASFFVRNEATARMFWIVVGLILALEYWRRANEEVDPALAESAVALDRPQAGGPAAGRSRWLPSRQSVLR